MMTSVCPEIQVTKKEDLVFLGSPAGAQARRVCLTDKRGALDTMMSRLSQVSAHHALFLLKNCFAMPRLLYFLRSAPCFLEQDLLESHDELLRKALENLLNIKFSVTSFEQALLPVCFSGLGVTSAAQLAASAFLASASGCQQLCDVILAATPDYTIPCYNDAFLQWTQQSGLSSVPLDRSLQKSWTHPIRKKIFLKLSEDLSPFDRTRLFAFSGKEAGAWLNASEEKPAEQ